jgi:hypothetical protein
MLKVEVPGSQRDEKVLEALASAFNRLLDDGSKTGYVKVYAYPTGDSLAAMVFVARRLLAAGVRPVMAVSLRYPPPEAPMVLLGYDNVSFRAGEVEHTVVALASGDMRGKPVLNVYMFHGEGSVSALALAGVAGSIGYKGSWDPLIALAGFYLGRYAGREGRLHGLDRIMAEEVARVDTYSLEPYTGLRVYKPHHGDACTAIARTANPYYPGLTGDEDYCREALQAQGAGDMASKPLASATSEEELARLVEAVMEVVRARGAWRSFDEAVMDEYLGGFMISRQPMSPIQDLRMAADTLVYAAEAGGLRALAAIAADLDVEYQLAERALESYSSRLPRAVEAAKPRRLRVQSKYRVYLVDADRVDSPYLLWKALSLLGFVERDAIIALDLGDEGALISPLQAEAAAGSGAARRLVDSKIAEGEGLELWLRRVSA